MKAMVIDESFGIDRLKVVERDDPACGPRQIVIRMKSAALNYRDLMMIQGTYNPNQPLPLVPGSDGVGIVEDLGSEVRRFEKGDRVSPIFAQEWISGKPTLRRLRQTLGGPHDGVIRQYVVVDENAAVKVPPHLDNNEAATLPCAALTAWTTLVTQGGIKAGNWVLVQGSGGVSIFALQFAKLCGARVIALSSSDEKIEKMKALGAEATINYRQNPEWGRQVRQIADGSGVDLVVEVGGAQTISQSIAAAAIGGYIGLIGVLSGRESPLEFRGVFMKCLRIDGIFVGHRDSFEEMNAAISSSKLSPVVDRVFSWTDLPAALEHLKKGAHFGKVCLEIEG